MSFDSSAGTRWVKRLALPILLVCMIVFCRSYWFVVVPAGMDTMPELYPPGTTCVVQRDPGQLVAGSVVFVEVEAGAAPILVRIARVEGGRVHLLVENPRSQFAGYTKDDYPLSSVRALVLSGVPPEAETPSAPRNN